MAQLSENYDTKITISLRVCTNANITIFFKFKLKKGRDPDG